MNFSFCSMQAFFYISCTEYKNQSYFTIDVRFHSLITAGKSWQSEKAPRPFCIFPLGDQVRRFTSYRGMHYAHPGA